MAGIYEVGLGTGSVFVNEFGVGFGIVVVAGPVVKKTESAKELKQMLEFGMWWLTVM